MCYYPRGRSQNFGGFMEKNLFLSIVIPMYNTEEHIIKCLESLDNQTIKDFEVIVIDDGSTDSSYKKAKLYLEKTDLTYKIIKQNNQGQSVARNVGIKTATAQYLLFLDSDDFAEKTLVERTKEEVLSTHFDIVMFDYKRVKENGTVILSDKQDFDFSKGIQDGIEVFYGYTDNRLRLWTSSLIYNREFIIENKLQYLEDCYGAEDLNFIFKSLFLAKNVRYINQVLSYYYQRSDSLTNTHNINKNITVVDAMENLCEFIKAKGLNSNLEKIIRCEFIQEHIMYQILGCTNEDNKAEIIKVLKQCKVRKYLKNGKYHTTRYGKIVFVWMKLACYIPNGFVKIYLKRKR